MERPEPGCLRARRSPDSLIGTVGYLIIAVFALRWTASVVNYHVRGYDRLEVKAG
jgi:hypothetical protein